MLRKFLSKYLSLAIALGMSLFIWIPLVLLISGSFMGLDEIKDAFGPILLGREGYGSWPLIPSYPTVRPYIELLLDSPEFFVMFWNTLKMVIPILVGQILFGMPAAWALARFKFPGRGWIFTLYIALMLMPFQVTMVPNYLVLDQFQLLDTRLGIILPAAFSTFPVFIMYQFFKSIPETMIEAIKIDGGGNLRAFIHVGVPLGAPGVISVLVLGFLEYWNMIEQPMTFLQSKSLWPLSLYLPRITTEQLGVSIAASIMMLIPSFIVFLWGQNDLEAGIRSAGIKE